MVDGEDGEHDGDRVAMDLILDHLMDSILACFPWRRHIRPACMCLSGVYKVVAIATTFKANTIVVKFYNYSLHT